MVVGFATTCPISAYHRRREFESRTWRSVHGTIFCDKVCQWLATGRWFSVWIPPPIKLFKLSAIHKYVCGRNIILCGRGRVQGGIWNNVKFQNEQKTYFILARVRIIWMYETRWVTFGRQTTRDGNKHGMKWPKSLL
jgi:hypothetical protein